MKADINESDFLKYYKSALPSQDSDEEVPEISRPSRSSPFWIVLFVLIGMFAGLAGIGYLLFGTSQGSAKVEVSLDGPTEIASGAEVLYTIAIANKDSTPLTDTSLIATFPDGFEFVYSSEDPKNSKKNYWALGEIAGFQNKVITLRGRMSGIKNESKDLALAFQYHQRGVSAEFGTSARFQTKMSSSALTIQLIGPAQLTEGEEGVYTITYDSFDTYAKKSDVEVRVTPAEGFKQTELSPKSDHDLIWSADTLLKAIDPIKKSGTITIRGSFSETTPGVKVMTATIGGKEGEQFHAEQTASLDTTLTGSDVKARLLINGSNRSAPLPLTSPIVVTIPIENTGTSQLTSLSVSLSLTSPVLDWTRLENPHNGIIKDTTVTWTESEVPQLKLLKPGEKTGLSLTLYLKSAEQISSLPDEVQSLDPFSLTTLVSISGKKLVVKGEGVSEEPFTSEPITLANLINGDTAITSKLLPSQAGEQTRYRALWTVSNTMHELSNLTFTARLPKNVEWLDETSLDAGSITFNPKTRVISWTLNRMPKSVPTLTIQFDIALTPKPAQKEAGVALLEKISFTATDKSTNGLIKLSEADETTPLSDDSTAPGVVTQ